MNGLSLFQVFFWNFSLAVLSVILRFKSRVFYKAVSLRLLGTLVVGVLIGQVGSISICHAGQMYKYKDADGNLTFSDKPPKEALTFETLAYTEAKKSTAKIRFFYTKNSDSDSYTLNVSNKLYAPIEVKVHNPDTQVPISKVIAARSSAVMFDCHTKTGKLNFSWALGDPDIKVKKHLYHAPFVSLKGFRVTQGFNGQFSHTSDYSKYAVDIAMEVGTYLTAVRPGTVVWVKDDYHMSGTTKYFLDKANVIKVLHDDGTLASYAHILMDTAVVKEGDKVALGERLARSGSSGFSTGPHLHFSIIKNTGLKNISIPFEFIDNEGAAFTPERNMIMVGIR